MSSDNRTHGKHSPAHILILMELVQQIFEMSYSEVTLRKHFVFVVHLNGCNLIASDNFLRRSFGVNIQMELHFCPNSGTTKSIAKGVQTNALLGATG